jgi:hypothetical protein
MVYGSYTSVMDAIVYGYKPELDLANWTFIPPIEITIQIKQPIPDWVKLDVDSATKHQSKPLPHSAIPTLDWWWSAPTTTTCPHLPHEGLCKQVFFDSWTPKSSTPYIINGKPMMLSPWCCDAHNLLATDISVASIVGQSSLHTSLTKLLSDAGLQPMFIVSERKGAVWPRLVVNNPLL